MKQLARFLAPYKKECILGPICKLTEAILELLIPTMMALMIENGVKQGNTTYIWEMGGLLLFVTLCGYGAAFVCQYYASRASQGFGTSLRREVFSRISRLSPKEHDRFSSSSLINRLTTDINQLQQAVAMSIRLLSRVPFICIGSIIMAFLLDAQLALVFVVSVPAFCVVIWLLMKKTSPLYRAYQKKLDAVGSQVKENLSGQRVIRAFSKEGCQEEKFEEKSGELTENMLRVARMSALSSPLTGLCINLAVAAIVWFGGIGANAGDISQGNIMACINYMTYILLALMVASNLVVLFTKAGASMQRVLEVLDTKSSIPLDEGAQETAGSSTLLRFEHVDFRYHRTGELVLHDINVDLKRGETLGVIGGTGSGKSTLVSLVPRLYSASAGRVLFDGSDVKELNPVCLRSRVSMVPQKALLFSGTIRDNIRFGKPDASEEAVLKAASISQSQEFIEQFEDGLDHRIERGGQNLSGGQRQRLSIARGVCTAPELLILDDASSALDFATDAALRKALKTELAGTAVITVSQRAGAVMHCDRVLVLDDGEQVGLGTHEQLLKTCPIYREICVSQHVVQEVDA